MIAEGGINWCWFTDLTINDDNTITINKHFRLHRYDYRSDGQPWPKECIDAVSSSDWYGSQLWKEDEKRTALEYNVPERGWMKIANPQHIFSYER